MYMFNATLLIRYSTAMLVCVSVRLPKWLLMTANTPFLSNNMGAICGNTIIGPMALVCIKRSNFSRVGGEAVVSRSTTPAT